MGSQPSPTPTPPLLLSEHGNWKQNTNTAMNVKQHAVTDMKNNATLLRRIETNVTNFNRTTNVNFQPEQKQLQTPNR